MGKLFLKSWLMWLIAALFYALDYLQHTAPSVLIQPLATSLHTNFVTIGNIMSLYFPVYALCQLPAGYLLDRYELKYVLSSACILVSVGLLAMVTVSIPMLIIGRVAIAIGSAFAFLGALKAAANWLPPRLFPLAVGLTNSIGVLGGITGQSLLNNLILNYHWRRSIMFISLFGLILAAIIMFFLQHSPRKRQLLPQKFRFNKAAINRQTWFLAIYAGIMVGTVVNAFSELYDVVFLEKAFAIGSQHAAEISSMIFVGIAVGGPVHGLIARHFKHPGQWMLITCFLTIIIFTGTVFSALLIANLTLIFVLYFLVGFFVSSMLLAFALVRQQQNDQHQATSFALINMVIGLCGFIFQFLLGEAIKVVSQWHGGVMNTSVFLDAFWILLIPLLASLFFCYKIKAHHGTASASNPS